MTKETMHPKLREFLTAYLAWGKGGDMPVNFEPKYAMCSNLMTFIDEASSTEDDEALDELGHLLATAGLCTRFPFGVLAYSYDTENASHHLNPDRIKWIEDILSEQA